MSRKNRALHPKCPETRPSLLLLRYPCIIKRARDNDHSEEGVHNFTAYVFGMNIAAKRMKYSTPGRRP